MGRLFTNVSLISLDFCKFCQNVEGWLSPATTKILLADGKEVDRFITQKYICNEARKFGDLPSFEKKMLPEKSKSILSITISKIRSF